MNVTKEAVKGPGSDTGKGQLSVPVAADRGPGVPPPNHVRPTHVDSQESYGPSRKRTPIQLQYPAYEPEHRRGKDHLQLIRSLGYEGFNDLPIAFDYYEPTLPGGETAGQKNSRRQKECARLDEWIKRKTEEAFGAAPNVPNAPVAAQKTQSEEEEEEEETQSVTQKLKEENAYLREVACEYKEQEKYVVQLENQVSALKSKLQTYVDSLGTEKRERSLLEERIKKLEETFEQQKEENTRLREEVASHRAKQPVHLAELQKKLEAAKQEQMQERIEMNQLRLELQRKSLERENEPGTTAFSPLGEELQGAIAQMVQKAIADLMPKLQGTPFNAGCIDRLETPGTAELLKNSAGFQFPRRAKKKKGILAEVSVTPRAPGEGPIDYKDFQRQRRQQQEGPHDSPSTFSEAVKRRPNPAGQTSMQQRRPPQKRQQQQPERQQQRDQQPKSTDEKMLILPLGDKKTIVTTLREKGIRARQAGIKNAIEFPSGATLLIVEPGKVEALEQQVATLGHTRKAQKAKEQHTFRVHDIPIYNTVENVREDLTAVLGHAPLSIEFAYYKEEAKKDVRMAIVQCTTELWLAAEKRRTVAIDLKRCRVDTTIKLMRCQTCKLYGHTRNHCTGIPVEVAENHESTKSCLDCLMYNRRIAEAGLHKSRLRHAEHPSGSKDCPTKQALLRKYKMTAQKDGEQQQQ